MNIKSNTFRFGSEYYRQITGTTMATTMRSNYANLFTENFEQTYCVIILKKLDYHLWYGFILLTIFSLYGPLTRTRWIIPFPSRRITVNPKT